MKILCVGRNYSEHAKELGNANIIFDESGKLVAENKENYTKSVTHFVVNR